MHHSDFAPLKLFITGPTYIREEVKQAALLPEFGHRDAENNKRFAPIIANLKTLAGLPADTDYQVVIYNGSGSTAMESSIRSLVAADDVVLNVSVGAFGDLYHKMAVVNGKKAEQLRFEPGRAMDLAVLEQRLRKTSPQVVTITHNETSTGVTNDTVAACALIRAHGALPLVDGVSIFGGAPSEINEARPTMYCTATQKSLGLPAGFGIAFIGPDAFAKAEKVEFRGHSSDILGQLGRASKAQTLTTPNGTLANQMFVQLDHIVHREGVQNRFNRHIRMRDMVHAWVDAQDGFELFAQSGHRSPTLTAVRCPLGMSPKDLKALKETMRSKGYLFDPGYGKLNDSLAAEGKAAVFRIGHMGDITPEMLETYLYDLQNALLGR
ncbi:alanine--glyoxylate aminotransferase family protein [Desulfonatronum sp. SC1]|uniref:pyridoxal-phosphate-dependent aminotransferase family protein n=1 Tax=Desulfonatronum sp. SC1 TaxID=2109626 RepID=UPI000D32090E|nr:aminotransferase class V-fold PLP-dependent enzyme [Desulfonatronum sp. SC1]PTN37497.1 aminotransferase [Desulfonatronum sp. SC1]